MRILIGDNDVYQTRLEAIIAHLALFGYSQIILRFFIS